MRTPFTAPPISTPAASVARSACHDVSPPPPSSFERMIPDSASSDPTDRSMPPVRTTNVIPIETTHRIETPWSMFWRFALVRKSLWVAEKNTKMPTSRTSTAA